jgi:hypothetical protein
MNAIMGITRDKVNQPGIHKSFGSAPGGRTETPEKGLRSHLHQASIGNPLFQVTSAGLQQDVSFRMGDDGAYARMKQSVQLLANDRRSQEIG